MINFKKINSILVESESFINFHIHIGGSLFEKSFNKQIRLLEFIQFSDYWNNMLKLNLMDKKTWDLAADYSVKMAKYWGTSQICTMLGENILSNNNMRDSYIGYPFMISDKLKNYLNNAKKQYKEYRELLLKENIKPGIFFHSLYANDKATLKLASEIIHDYKNDFFQIHCAEDNETLNKVLVKFKKSPIQVLKDYNLLNKNTTIVHGCKLSDNDLKLIKDNDATIVICPVSNVRMGQKPLDPIRLNKIGVKWIIASDGLGTCDTLNSRYQAKVLKQCFPQTSYLDLWRAITTNPISNTNNTKIYFKVNNLKMLNDEQIAEYLIENYDNEIYDKTGTLFYNRKPRRKFCKFMPTLKDLKDYRRKYYD